jgi:hypothetical protein
MRNKEEGSRGESGPGQLAVDERNRRGEHRRRSGKPCDGNEPGRGGAQTFRRGKILVFLEQLQVKRATLAKQLGQPEFQAIYAMISSELKAVDQIIEEYVYLFDLREEREDQPKTNNGE